MTKVNFDHQLYKQIKKNQTNKKKHFVSLDSYWDSKFNNEQKSFNESYSSLKLVNNIEKKSIEINTNQVNNVISNSQSNQSLFSASAFNYQNKVDVTGEIIPWGVQSVWQGEDITKRGNFASDSYAFVIDSGVSNLTGDINLSPNSSWHRSWISGVSPFVDNNGHGTHVAGIIGSLVNGKGIVGVAPGAQIVSLKIYDSVLLGSGSDVTEAIQYAVNTINDNNLDKNKVVINLSLTGVFDPQMDSVIRNAADQGIRFTVAAGNNGQDVDNYSPSSAGDHPNVFTVSAVDNNFRMPSWSNWDRLDSNDQVDDVDFSAPGVGIVSYYKNGQLVTLSGTSMASPHVAGLLISGGVQSANLVTSSYANTSDVFVITNTQTYIPLPPPPTYTVTSNSSVNEGQTLRVDVATTNVQSGSILYWWISGNGVNLLDFNGLYERRGTVQVDNNGNASINLPVKEDVFTEGNEVVRFELFSDTDQSYKIDEKMITIQDTSKTPSLPLNLWGTIGNDVITGNSGNDRIAGVLSSGTSSTSMGFGQIDILTGGPGKDVFLLGDARGSFYDDKIASNLGSSDYALIQDFKPGEDKLQLRNRGFVYISESLNGSLSFYIDTNRNRKIEKFGPNQDELIAVLTGVNSLNNNDFIMI